MTRRRLGLIPHGLTRAFYHPYALKTTLFLLLVFLLPGMVRAEWHQFLLSPTRLATSSSTTGPPSFPLQGPSDPTMAARHASAYSCTYDGDTYVATAAASKQRLLSIQTQSSGPHYRVDIELCSPTHMAIQVVESDSPSSDNRWFITLQEHRWYLTLPTQHLRYALRPGPAGQLLVQGTHRGTLASIHTIRSSSGGGRVNFESSSSLPLTPFSAIKTPPIYQVRLDDVYLTFIVGLALAYIDIGNLWAFISSLPIGIVPPTINVATSSDDSPLQDSACFLGISSPAILNRTDQCRLDFQCIEYDTMVQNQLALQEAKGAWWNVKREARVKAAKKAVLALQVHLPAIAERKSEDSVSSLVVTTQGNERQDSEKMDRRRRECSPIRPLAQGAEQGIRKSDSLFEEVDLSSKSESIIRSFSDSEESAPALPEMVRSIALSSLRWGKEETESGEKDPMLPHSSPVSAVLSSPLASPPAIRSRLSPKDRMGMVLPLTAYRTVSNGPLLSGMKWPSSALLDMDSASEPCPTSCCSKVWRCMGWLYRRIFG